MTEQNTTAENTAAIQQSNPEKIAKASAIGWSIQLGKKLPATITTCPKSFGVTIDPGTGKDDVLEALEVFIAGSIRADFAKAAFRFSIGDAINHISNLENSSPTDVIDDMGLPLLMGLAAGTIVRFATTAARIPHKHRHITVSWTTFVEMASYKGVDVDSDPVAHVKFEEARMAVIDAAAADPERATREWATQKMRSLQKAGGVKPKRLVPLKELFEYGAKLFYLHDKVPVKDLPGGKTSGDLANALEEFENELINRKIIDPENLVWPELDTAINKEVVEAEVVEDGGEDQTPTYEPIAEEGGAE